VVTVTTDTVTKATRAAIVATNAVITGTTIATLATTTVATGTTVSGRGRGRAAKKGMTRRQSTST
jgi:hypothetical protein